MPTSVLAQIEERIHQLPIDEQLLLIERVAKRIREEMAKQHALEKQLAAMAADPEIQRELRKIDEEFAVTESDGLESL
jgi:hypothetical protein